MKHAFLIGTALWLALVGVWDHDWRLILCGLAVAVAWPLVCADVYAVASDGEEILLSTDSDLAESA